MECVICIEKIKECSKIQLKCNHIFHKECIIKCIRKRTRKCPLCRHKITWTIPYIKKYK